jgi:hypothetical protein
MNVVKYMYIEAGVCMNLIKYIYISSGLYELE